MISAERLQELSTNAGAVAQASPDTPCAVSAEELMGLCALAAGGLAGLDRLVDGVEAIRPEPGDLLLVRTPPYEGALLEALRAALTALSHRFRIRVLAMPEDCTFETVEGEALSSIVAQIRDWPITSPEGDALGLARICGDAGLAIQRVERAGAVS